MYWEEVRQRLNRAAAEAAPALLPFYRRFPYRGPLGLFDVDPRGAYSPTEGFFYNRVPKAANSTVMEALATRSRFRRRWGRPRTKSRFMRPLWMRPHDVERIGRDVFAFTIVRDPYRRVLSAFSDKILRRRPQSRRFFRRFGPAEPSFLDFLRYLEAGGLLDDPHWAPQACLMLLPIERFDFIGRVERLDDDLAHVIARIFGQAPFEATERAGPRTDSSRIFEQSYDREAIDLVNRLYLADFATFAYPMRDVRPARVRAGQVSSSGTERG